MDDPVNILDIFGLDPSVPPAPPGANIDKNISDAQSMSVLEWINHVREGGSWDYKSLFRKIGNFEDFGNFNYGATCMAQGFSPSICLRAAGAVQICQHIVNPKGHPYNPSQGTPVDSGAFGVGPKDGTFGDAPNDPYQIAQGILYYQDNH
jgi:hypothetical protein